MKIEKISRQDSEKQGLKHFYTGILCNEGHDSKRYTKNGQCVECSNKKSIEYVKKHKERILLTKAKNRAKNRNLEFNIDITDVVIPDFCPVLGIKLKKDGIGRFTDNSPTIDRIDNTKGYIKGNVAVISHRANHLKNSATLEELIGIYNYIKTKLNEIQ